MQHKTYILFVGGETNLNRKTILEEIEIILCLLVTSLLFFFISPTLSSLSCTINHKKKKKGRKDYRLINSICQQEIIWGGID